MKFIRKKIIKEREYYYIEYPLKINRRRRIISEYLGNSLTADLGTKIQEYFRGVAAIAEKHTNDSAKKFFMPKSILPIEQCRFWYQSLHHELFENDLNLFKSLFAVLFTLNSNRAEGSKVTRKNIEKLIKRKQKPKTLLDWEILDSFSALRFAFSKNMKWNIASLKTLHRLLLEHISPSIAGQFKKENVVINNEYTTDWKNVRKELKSLFAWFKKQKKHTYPPITALEFHHKFEAIHPFEDGNGRIGRLLLNAFLLQKGYMPVIFFSENHETYLAALSQARQGRKRKLAGYFIDQLNKTKTSILRYSTEGIIKGGSPQVGQWEIERGKIRRY